MRKVILLIEKINTKIAAPGKNVFAGLIFFSFLILNIACVERVPETVNTTSFNKSALKNLGDSISYGSYIIYKIGDGIYKINDPGSPEAILGGLIGTDIYVVCGENKSLVIDLGNNYIDGFPGDKIAPRDNAKEEFLDLLNGLSGNLPFEVAVTHMHPDHCGMTGAFVGSDVPLWIGEGEDMNRLKTMYNIDPSIYRIFKQGEKTFDLGGGRILETFMVRGHSNGESVFLLKPDMLLFTGDAISPGPRRIRELRSIEAFNQFTEDINKLVDHIKNNFEPYERYGLQVYTGHSGEMMYNATKDENENQIMVDAGYGEWRFVQNMANCVNGIVDGTWLDETTGFHSFEVAPGRNGEKQVQITYYLGSVVIPLSVAYEASGLGLPENP